MIPYGEKKRKNKRHPHNECSVCSEKSIIKKCARQQARQNIQEELTSLPFYIAGDPPMTHYESSGSYLSTVAEIQMWRMLKK